MIVLDVNGEQKPSRLAATFAAETLDVSEIVAQLNAFYKYETNRSVKVLFAIARVSFAAEGSTGKALEDRWRVWKDFSDSCNKGPF